MRSPRPTVAVVGGGIAGLAAAWELSRAGTGPEVTVLEADGQPGGKIRTGELGGRRIDLGPDAFVTRRPEALSLCRELGLEGELVEPATGSAYLWNGGRLRALPAGLALGVPTRLVPLARSGVLSPWGVGRAALDLLAPPLGAGHRARGTDTAVGELVRRRLGREVAQRLADPLIGGIHAGRADHMSAAAVFPALLEAAGRPGSLMRALRRLSPAPAAPTTTATPPAAPAPGGIFAGLHGGMSLLVTRLASALEGAGAEVRVRFPVQSLERAERWVLHGPGGERIEADAVVLAAPSPLSAALVRPHSARLAQLLDSVEYAGVVVATMRFRSTDVAALPPGSGFLVPRTGDAMVTACTWMSSKWPALARPDDVLVRASLGRYGDERPLALDDDAVVRRATEELAPAMGLRAAPAETAVTRFPAAFPQYTVGHLSKVAAMEQAAAGVGGLALAGSYLRGVGIPACIASGRRAGQAVSSQLEEAAWR